MISNNPKRLGRHLFRLALLATGTAGLLVNVASAKDKDQSAAPKLTPSAKFIPAYQDFSKKLDADKKRPDVIAAQDKVKAATEDAAQKAALADLGGLLTADKAQFPTVVAAASTPDDHYYAGQLELQLGLVTLDTNIQRQALADMLATGKVPPADVGNFQNHIGLFDYQAGDYPGAITAFQAAIAAGFQDSNTNILLADSYLRNHQLDKGLPALQHAIDLQKASGQPVPVGWYRTGVVAAYNAKLVDPTVAFGAGLIQDEPTQKNWQLLLEVLQSVAHYEPADELDLMRLMARTHSYAEKGDYLEYIQVADARRLPGEVLDVIAAGEAAGMLSANDPSVADAKTTASGRVTGDKASLPQLERDARAPGASELVAKAAGDATLSYGLGAESIEMYKIALDKPNANTALLLTRMGIAQIDTGDFAGAQATLAKVTGPRQPLAQLWSIYAAEKAAGK